MTWRNGRRMDGLRSLRWLRFSGEPMAIGMPRREGLSRCSTDAKKASMSMWMILRNSIGYFYKVNEFLGKDMKRKFKI